MKKYFLLLFLLTWGIAPLLATDPVNTRMLSQPATSATQIAFIYAEDLWVADINGANPRRITVDEGVESNPVFSPDGKMIAFNAEYDGNVDVFIVPAQGGVPVRLTWHPGNDQVRGFTPNGQSVLFISQREVFTTRYQQLFTVPVNGGMPVKLEIPNAFWAAYSPDGKQLVYTPLADAFKQWKNYRGGTHSVLWVYSFADKSTYKIPQPEGGCNDVNPVWLGNTIYFRSDRNGEFNLFSYHTGTKKLEQLTTYNDFPVLYINGAGEKIILEQAGYLHQYTPGSAQARKLTIGIAADLLELRPRFVKGAKYIRSAALSPSGARAVFDLRGDIVTVPAEKGDHRNITATTGAHEKFPAWSADGRSIAYFSDATGEYQLVIQQQDGKGEPRRYALNGSGFYAHASWSPDGRKISYTDNARNLYVLDVASGSSTKIASDDVYTLGAFRNMANDWSHDSKWLAYTRVLETQFRQVFLYSVEQQRSFPLTDGLSDAVDPVFDRNGRYLYFLASTDAGPVINWFNQSNSDHRETFSIYAVTLQKETASPFPRENDEEQMITEADSTKTPARKKPGALVIHWEGIQNRIVDVPLKPGIYSRLSMGKEDELLFLSGTHETPANRTLCKYDVSKRKFTELAEADSYTLSANGKKMLYAKGQTWTIANSGEKPEAGKGVLNLADVDIYIEPRAEWANMLDEVWRINRDYFYDPGMHGANWPAMKKKVRSVFAAPVHP